MEENQEKRWYIAQTSAGFENSVKTNLERRIKSMGMEEYIFQAFIPEVLELEVKADGKKVEKLKKMFPSYVFVEMIVTDESWFVVRNTPGCTGFLGSSGGGTKPVPLSSEEITPILKKCGKLEEVEFEGKIGDKVLIIEGPFKGQIGVVDRIDNSNQKLVVLVYLFGRNTSVELSFFGIELRR